MMLETVSQFCPYCGEPIELVIDCSILQQQYVEDCQVCCRPMIVNVMLDEKDLPVVDVCAEDD